MIRSEVLSNEDAQEKERGKGKGYRNNESKGGVCSWTREETRRDGIRISLRGSGRRF